MELLEAALAGPDGEVMRARAWRVAAGELRWTSGESPPPGPDSAEPRPFFPTGEEVGYHTAMEYRFASGGFLEPGPATVWMRMRGRWWRASSRPRFSGCSLRPTPATA